MFSRSIQTYTSAAGLPWTVATLGGLSLAHFNHRVYAWVGLDADHPYRLRTAITVNLKYGSVVVDTFSSSLVSKSLIISSTPTFADSLTGQVAEAAGDLRSIASESVEFRFYAGNSGNIANPLGFVQIRPVRVRAVVDNAELIVNSMSWETLGALSATYPLVCYLGVLSSQ